MKRSNTTRALLLAVLVAAAPVRTARAHWCHDLWGSSYNLVLRPASDVVAVPATGSATLEVWVQNNMGYPLRTFAMTARATGYTINVSRQASKVTGYLMPGEKLQHTLTITRAGGASLPVESIDFFVTFGSGGQSGEYPQAPGEAVVIRKMDGTLAPAGFPNIGQGYDQAAHLLSAAVADYTDLAGGLDDLLQEYCAGRASWDHSGSAVRTTYCPDTSRTVCPARQTGVDGTKYDFQKLWAAQELAYRKSALGARLPVLRERLRCGWDDVNLAFRGFAAFVLGYLGEDAASRTFLEGIISSGTAEERDIAKASLLMFGNMADRTAHHADVVTCSSSANKYVRAVCAGALGIVDEDDAAVERVLLADARWIEPDTADNGAAFFASHVLALVAWDRRSWAARAGDTGTVSFYEGMPPPPDRTPPAAPANVRCTPSPGGTIRVSWDQVTRDANGQPETASQYRVYWGNMAGDRAHVDMTSAIYRDYPSLDGMLTYYYSVIAVDAAGNASAASSEVSCTPRHAPRAVIRCAPTTGTPPLTVNCDADQSTDPNGAADIASTGFTLDGMAEQPGPRVTYDFPNPGGHTVVLRVTDRAGLMNTAQTTINVSSPNNQTPVARASATPNMGQAPLAVRFSSMGSSDPDAGQTLSYSWDFRDGTNSTDPNPMHTFASAGSFDVVLTVTDDGTPPASATAVATVVVSGNRAPDVSGASASPDTGRPPLTVHFNAAGVTDPDGNDVAITWSFGDGTPDSTDPTVDHVYTAPGNYTAELSAQDNGTPRVPPATRTFNITVSTSPPANRPPSCATATVTPARGVAPLSVVLDASGCTDPEGQQMTYLWRIPTSLVTEDTFTTPRADYTFSVPGEVTIQLLVSDTAQTPMETNRDFTVVVVGTDSSEQGIRLAGQVGGGCGCSASGSRSGSALDALGVLALALALFGRRLSRRSSPRAPRSRSDEGQPRRTTPWPFR